MIDDKVEQLVKGKTDQEILDFFSLSFSRATGFFVDIFIRDHRIVLSGMGKEVTILKKYLKDRRWDVFLRAIHILEHYVTGKESYDLNYV